MTASIATELALRLAALPFLERSYGLVRVVEELRPVPGSADQRLVRYPEPVDVLAEPCTPDLLLPSPKRASVAFFEEDASVLGGTRDYRSLTATLKLVVWVNTKRLSVALPEGALAAVLVNTLEGQLSAAGFSNGTVKVLSLSSGDGATLLSRYTLTEEARTLLHAPYVFCGATVRVVGYLTPAACLPALPTLKDAALCR